MQLKAEWKSVKTMLENVKKEKSKDLPAEGSQLILLGIYTTAIGAFESALLLARFINNTLTYKDISDEQQPRFIPLFWDYFTIENLPKIEIMLSDGLKIDSDYWIVNDPESGFKASKKKKDKDKN
jgi:hypothetical protein